MIRARVTIVNRLGLHARAAARLVNCAAVHSSRIRIGRESQMVDARSIMALLMLAAGKGSELQLEVEGADEEEAAAAVTRLIADGFGESD